MGRKVQLQYPPYYQKISGDSKNAGAQQIKVLNVMESLGFSIRLSLFNKLHLIDLTEEIVRTFHFK